MVKSARSLDLGDLDSKPSYDAPNKQVCNLFEKKKANLGQAISVKL